MNLVLFLLAGYETTSNTLSNCAYVLATHSEEQEILLDEIRSHFDTVFNLNRLILLLNH
jgi:cytochrome P450